MDKEKTTTSKKPKTSARSDDKRVPVRTIKADKAGVLVEWYDPANETYHRAIVPARAVTQDACSQAALEKSKPYGVDWAGLIELTISPEAIANELHRRGIWTKEELAANPQGALGAFRAVLQQDFSAFQTAVKAGK